MLHLVAALKLFCFSCSTFQRQGRAFSGNNPKFPVVSRLRIKQRSDCVPRPVGTDHSDNGDHPQKINDSKTLSRRCVLQRSVEAGVAASLVLRPRLVSATDTVASSSTFIAPSEAKVTHKVFMNVRISRQDGTFYVRDDLPDTPENRVFSCRLVLGLFGKNCPTHVGRFLSYVQPSETTVAKDEDEDDNPLPNYGRSYFTALDQSTGLLVGGMIPSLELTEIGGNTAL